MPPTFSFLVALASACLEKKEKNNEEMEEPLHIAAQRPFASLFTARIGSIFPHFEERMSPPPTVTDHQALF